MINTSETADHGPAPNPPSAQPSTLIEEFQISLDLVLAFRKFFSSEISEKSSHDKALKKLSTIFHQACPSLVPNPLKIS
jgi:hypothetical protein